MKKLQILLLLIMIIISSTSFARDRLTNDDRQRKAAVIEAAAEVSSNRSTITELSAEVRVKTKLAKEKLQILVENTDSITLEQLYRLKSSVVLIKEHQKVIRNTLGQIKAYNEDIRISRQNKDFDRLLILYNEIISIQNTRIRHLNKYNEILDNLINNL